MPEEQKAKIGASNRARGKAKTPTKQCPRCKAILKREEFGVRPNGWTKSYCPPCQAAYHQERAAITPAEIRDRNNAKARAHYHRNRDNPEYIARVRRHSRKAQFKVKYGITLDDYEAMKLGQGGACAICQEEPEDHNLYVDHNHTTGTVRALLCRRCNCGVGYFRDNPEVMEAAAAYVRRFTASAVDSDVVAVLG